MLGTSKIICCIGAGGKSTYLAQEIVRAQAQGKRCALTTTTHICAQQDLEVQLKRLGVNLNTLTIAGTPCAHGKKLSALSEADFRSLCFAHDIVFVEADGSHCLPVKIPSHTEPVIPDGVDEIVCVMGGAALGRQLGDVCQRFELICDRYKRDTIIDEALLEELVHTYYEKPLKVKYPQARFSYYLSRPTDSLQTYREQQIIQPILTASGFSRRFGKKDKLLAKLGDKKLVDYAIENISSAAQLINSSSYAQYISCRPLLVLGQSDAVQKEVMRFSHNDVVYKHNQYASLGLSAAIHLGARYAWEQHAHIACYFVADQPYLSAQDIARFLLLSVASHKTYGAMYADFTSRNPGLLRLDRSCARKDFDYIQNDHGPITCIRSHQSDTYLYPIDVRALQDIDTPEQLVN